MHRSTVVLSVAASLAFGLAAVPATASPGTRPPALTGRAVLPADALADGPPSGAALVPAGQATTDINGIAFPRPSQPVIGFSAVVDGRHPGEFLAMPDNGFGNKQNSKDFLIRAYDVAPAFKTARGGAGTIDVRGVIQFSDPRGLLTFPLERPDRLLTGADIDPESLQIGRDGTYWMGEEFGPWILHFAADGTLLDAPYALPDGLRSPANPFLNGAAPTQPGSRGIEAMAISPNGRYLYAVLEGATTAEAPSTHRIVFQFDTSARRFTANRWSYQTQLVPNMMADAWMLDDHRIAVIERDGGLGLNATFRQVREIDLRDVDAAGNLVTRLLVDLTAIADPDGVSLPALHEGDVGIGDPFRVTCESIEGLHVLDGSRLLLTCDNNLPNKGRNPGRADDTEMIIVTVPGLHGHR